MGPSPFFVGTCEGISNDPRRLPFEFEPSAPLRPFEADDPLGLRRAVVPVFRRDALTGELYGMGTAFHVDGWGRFLSADHVVDFMRMPARRGGDPLLNPLEVDPSVTDHAVLYLGMNGVVYGQVPIPDTAFAAVTSVGCLTMPRDDPMARLQGRSHMQVAADLAVLHAGIHAEATMPHSLPVRLEGWDPQVGEHVLAVGYPLLDSQRIDAAELRSLLREGMFAGYGRVTKVYPHGRDLANPTPAFEVEADWPSGMSGGPVFNCQGEVVGVVSRGLSPDEQSPGCAWAACLPWISMPAGFLPTLDPANPGWRRGIAAVHTVSGQLVGIFESTEEARRFRNNAVTFSACSHRIGSTDFVLES